MNTIEEPKLLLPWETGFWDIYYSRLPPNWINFLKGDKPAYLAPSLTTGELTSIKHPQEYYDYQEEFQDWHQNSLIDPFADPFENWYPLCELDREREKENQEVLELII